MTGRRPDGAGDRTSGGQTLDTELDEEQAEYARTAKSSGEAFLGVINDILDVSKIEAGKLENSMKGDRERCLAAGMDD